MNVNSLVKIALFSAITAVLSQVAIPIGPVPISLGTMAVYLTAVFLSPRDAFLAQCSYLLLGVVGLPVFSNFGSGIGHLMGPTGGFAFSYPFVAFIVALSISKSSGLGINIRLMIKGFGLVIATSLCYLLGIIWFMRVTGMNLSASIPLVLLPFLLGDSIKIVVTLIVSEKVKRSSY